MLGTGAAADMWQGFTEGVRGGAAGSPAVGEDYEAGFALIGPSRAVPARTSLGPATTPPAASGDEGGDTGMRV
ncbi:hypothetical protein ACH5A3_11550 [Streptomyces echinatus]|uniref:hypothetical protein n=1 Tax=Streptomyces echinatus TaxID=67293 RepID=UPI0037A36223